jgi:hypothetical protein
MPRPPSVSLDQSHPQSLLLQWNKPRTVCRANTRPSVLDRLVTDAELAQVEPHHLRLDLDLVELLPAVDTDHGADHLGHDNHVAQVRLDEVWLLVGLGGLFRFAEFFYQAHGLALEAAVEAAAGAGVDDVAELFGGEVEESVFLLERRGWVGCCVGLVGLGCGSPCLFGGPAGERVQTYWSRSMPR